MDIADHGRDHERESPVVGLYLEHMLDPFSVELSRFRFPWDPIMVGVASSAVVAITGYIASIIIPPKTDRKEVPTLWDFRKQDSSNPALKVYILMQGNLARFDSGHCRD